VRLVVEKNVGESDNDDDWEDHENEPGEEDADGTNGDDNNDDSKDEQEEEEEPSAVHKYPKKKGSVGLSEVSLELEGDVGDERQLCSTNVSLKEVMQQLYFENACLSRMWTFPKSKLKWPVVLGFKTLNEYVTFMFWPRMEH
jgi:hypothetical protein